MVSGGFLHSHHRGNCFLGLTAWSHQALSRLRCCWGLVSCCLRTTGTGPDPSLQLEETPVAPGYQDLKLTGFLGCKQQTEYFQRSVRGRPSRHVDLLQSNSGCHHLSYTRTTRGWQCTPPLSRKGLPRRPGKGLYFNAEGLVDLFNQRRAKALLQPLVGQLLQHLVLPRRRHLFLRSFQDKDEGRGGRAHRRRSRRELEVVGCRNGGLPFSTIKDCLYSVKRDCPKTSRPLPKLRPPPPHFTITNTWGWQCKWLPQPRGQDRLRRMRKVACQRDGMKQIRAPTGCVVSAAARTSSPGSLVCWVRSERVLGLRRIEDALGGVDSRCCGLRRLTSLFDQWRSRWACTPEDALHIVNVEEVTVMRRWRAKLFRPSSTRFRT